MRILLLLGSHPRHIFFATKIIEAHKLVSVIHLERENFVPSSNHVTNIHDRKLHAKHFKKRAETEMSYFGNLGPMDNAIRVTEDNFDPTVLNFLYENSPDLVIIFGTGLVSDTLLSLMPNLTINLHLGLSPNYKGSATLFWPFYMMEPNFAGFTFHKVTNKIDGGPIIHQGVPELFFNDGIHDVACRTVLLASKAAIEIINAVENNGFLFATQQLKNGKLWLDSDFKPEHLRINYDVFQDQMVKALLERTINPRIPTLVGLNTQETIKMGLKISNSTKGPSRA